MSAVTGKENFISLIANKAYSISSDARPYLPFKTNCKETIIYFEKWVKNAWEPHDPCGKSEQYTVFANNRKTVKCYRIGSAYVTPNTKAPQASVLTSEGYTFYKIPEKGTEFGTIAKSKATLKHLIFRVRCYKLVDGKITAVRQEVFFQHYNINFYRYNFNQKQLFQNIAEKILKKKVNDFKREVPNLKKELSDKKYTGVDDSILQEAILKALSTETKKRQASPTTIDHTPRQAKRSTSMPTRYSIAQLEYKRNALDKRLKQVETEIETVKEAQDKLNKENEELERMTINKDREIDEAKHLNYSFKHWYSNLVARYEKQKQEIAYLKAENIRLQRLQEEKDKFSLSIDLWDDGNTSVNDLDAMELWDTYEQSDGARINL